MTSSMTRVAARILLLPLVVIALAIMIKGYADIGDGFSAGVIASMAMIIQAVAFGADELEHSFVFRAAPLAAFAGLGLSLLVAFVPLVFGDPIFLHQPEAGRHAVHFGSLEFITPVVFDTGVFLVVFGCCAGSIGAIGRESSRRQRERT